MRYAAIAVLMADGDLTTVWSTSPSVKGSLSSPEGDVKGGVRVGMVLALVSRRPTEDCRWLLPDVGDARRERVLRKVDLRFGGAGMESGLMGRTGILTVGCESRSF